VTLFKRQATGFEYLALVTQLLQQARLVSATGGLWEAADMHWWWRIDQHPEPEHQTFWMDGDSPVAAVVFQNWGEHLECVLMGVDGLGPPLSEIWATALEKLEATEPEPVDMIIRDDDTMLIELAERAGFKDTNEPTMTCWMDADERRPIRAIAEGFELLTRSDTSDRPHPMIPRNPDDVADRLAECSLYRPELDLSVWSATGEVAGYGLFWPDPVTRVGLVEPMRTNDEYQGRGIASHLFDSGLEGLAEAGCTRLKVTYEVGNEAAQRAYLGAGFHPTTGDRTYRREP